VDGWLVTNGGRVMSVTATGASVEATRFAAYQAVGSVRFEGMQYRSDIAESI
jgi:phosphoribosylamine--glycine ligase